MSRNTDERLAAVTARYDGPDNEAARLLVDVQRRLAWRRRHSGKECSKCLEVKPLGAFGQDSGRPDGLAHRCRDCDSARKRESRASRV